jgi:hypothetical protein
LELICRYWSNNTSITVSSSTTEYTVVYTLTAVPSLGNKRNSNGETLVNTRVTNASVCNGTATIAATGTATVELI